MMFETFDRQAVCDVHGEYSERGSRWTPDSEARWSGCAECHKAKQDAEKRQQAQSDARCRVANASLPRRHASSTFSTFQPRDEQAKKNLATVKAWVALVQSGTYAGQPLTLIGAAGRGKTHLACAAVGCLAWHGDRASYITANGIERLARDFEGGTHARAELERVGVLALDELGLEARGDFVRAAVSQVLHARYDALLPTIVVSNLDAGGITDAYGQGIADRYVRDAFVVKFSGQSQRGAK